MSGGVNIFWWEFPDINMYIGKEQKMVGRSSVYYVSNLPNDSKSSEKIDKFEFITHYYNNGKLLVYNLDNTKSHVEKEYNGEVYIERQYDTLYEDTVLYQIATNSPTDAFKDLHKLAVAKLNKHKEEIGRRIDAEYKTKHQSLPENEKLEHTNKYIANNHQLSLPFPYRTPI
jgi:hypothetical protein